jgi:hypothetical protein
VLAGFGKLILAVYSQSTGFFGEVSLFGGLLGTGGQLELNLYDDWYGLEVSHGFSPSDLHGAPGSLKFAVGSLGGGGAVIWGSARMKGTKDYLFEDCYFGDGVVGLGAGGGYLRGQWKFEQVWSEDGIPLSSR